MPPGGEPPTGDSLRSRASASGLASRMDALTGIRAIAAFWVVAYHFAISPFEALQLQQRMPFVKYGYLGVDLFFLLSGFILIHVHGRDTATLAPRPVLRFYALRLSRIYPVHVLTLFALAVMFGGGMLLGFTPHHPEDFRFGDFIANLLLVQSWGFADDIHWNFPSWSLSCEWLAYLLFPLLAIALARIASRRAAVQWLAAVAGAFALAYVFYFRCDLDLRFDVGGFAHLALPRVGFEFALGALCYKLLQFADLRNWPWLAIVLGAIVAATLLAATPARDFAIVCVFALVIVAGSMKRNFVARILSAPLLVYLGEISYSLYMVHVPIRMTLGKAAESAIARSNSLAEAGAIAVSLMLVTIGVAAAVNAFVEIPARRWMRRAALNRLMPRHGSLGDAGLPASRISARSAPEITRS